MPEWFRPVSKVGDVIVVGEEHRHRPSKELVDEVIKHHDLAAVCVEESPNVGYRDDRGGAIGHSLVWAESNEVPRYYVDIPTKEIKQAFGGSYTAYSYLKDLRKRAPLHDEGLADQEFIQEVRNEFEDEFGKSAFRTIFTKREKLMASRAKHVSNQVNGKVLLVVGSGHFDSIVQQLPNLEPLSITDKRKRTGERITGGPWTVMLTVMFKPIIKMFREQLSKAT